jgi:hypothetical protein
MMTTRARHFLLPAAVATLAVVLLAACGDEDSDDASAPEADGPAVVTERFFHWYVSERNLGREPMAAAALRSNGDVTRGFIEAMASAAAGMNDPMLCQGEIPHAFSVGEPTISGAASRVTVASTVSHAAWRVDLQREGAAWKIASIACATR